MVDMSASQIIRRSFCFAFANVLFLLIIVLLGMNTNVSGRPIEWSDSSAEDILAGVDFLSVFMNSAEERKNYHNHDHNDNHNDPQIKITTHHPSLTKRKTTDKPFEELIFEYASSTPFDNSLINNKNDEKEEDAPTTTIETSLNTEESTTIIPETTTIQEQPEITTKRGTFVKNNPSAIQSNSKRNIFNIDIAEPITIESQKVKRKSEDLLAIGANPDYIAQQHARINRDNQYNHPYNQRNPTASSRGRSVSYSTVIQVLPPEQVKPWKQEDEGYTETYPDYNSNKTFKHVASTAESKDYFVTRKYNSENPGNPVNPVEYNESGDKDPSKTNLELKKNYQTTERNWGLPEKIYGVPEKTYNPQQYTKLQQEILNYQTTERNWGLPEKQYTESRGSYSRPEQNYEVDEAISVRTNGRTHGIQEPKTPEKPLQFKVGQTPVKPDDNQKVGYVVEGRNYRKYRVEERTPDGFIVGEYGVVSNNDGSLRGVRYTADGTINPRVIYDALMKFLAL